MAWSCDLGSNKAPDSITYPECIIKTRDSVIFIEIDRAVLKKSHLEVMMWISKGIVLQLQLETMVTWDWS